MADEFAASLLNSSAGGGSADPAAVSGSMADSLSGEQRRTLYVLGYLYLRMGWHERSKRLFAALVTLDSGDSWARRNLAAACLALGEYEAALDHLRLAVGNGLLSSRDAALHLLRARALWGMGRHAEARNAVNAYLAGGGDPVVSPFGQPVGQSAESLDHKGSPS